MRTPVAVHGIDGRYASALYSAASKQESHSINQAHPTILTKFLLNFWIFKDTFYFLPILLLSRSTLVELE